MSSEYPVVTIAAISGVEFWGQNVIGESDGKRGSQLLTFRKSLAELPWIIFVHRLHQSRNLGMKEFEVRFHSFLYHVRRQSCIVLTFLLTFDHFECC